MTSTAGSDRGLAAKAAELLASGPDRSPPSYGVPKGGGEDPAADIASMLTMYAQAAKLMVGLPRYRYLQAYQLDACLLEPLLEGCVEWAFTPQQSGGSSSGSEQIVLGFAIWARVSTDVDESIRAQIDARAFPVHLKQSDWKSGTITWLLDVIAPTRNLAEEVLAAVLETAPPGPVHIHPAAKAAVGEAWWARKNAHRDSADRGAP